MMGSTDYILNSNKIYQYQYNRKVTTMTQRKKLFLAALITCITCAMPFCLVGETPAVPPAAVKTADTAVQQTEAAVKTAAADIKAEVPAEAAKEAAAPAEEAEKPAAKNMFVGTFWALVPPLVAILLALITKEVYSSLFIGILLGGCFAANFAPLAVLDAVIGKGLIDAIKSTAGIFLFLLILGAMVALISKTGAAAAFGRWAQTHGKPPGTL